MNYLFLLALKICDIYIISSNQHFDSMSYIGKCMTERSLNIVCVIKKWITMLKEWNMEIKNMAEITLKNLKVAVYYLVCTFKHGK